MSTKSFIILLGSVLLFACSRATEKEGLEKYSHNFDGLLDTLLPHFAKLHDSIPAVKKFEKVYHEYMQVHKKERDYHWLNYAETPNGYAYFLISRNEPSVKRDKFLAICGRFKRNKLGAVDSASYEEIFWTWKMRLPELASKSDQLFRLVLKGESIEPYTPGKKDEEWIEFPGNGVVYDKSSQTWVQTRLP